MKKMCKPNRLLLFITIPQLILAVYLLLNYLKNQRTETLILLFLAMVINTVFTAYAIHRRKAQETPSAVYITTFASYTVYLILSAVLLDQSINVLPFVNARLLSIVCCVLPMLYAALCFYKYRVQGDGDNMTRYIISLVIIPIIWFLLYNVFSGINIHTASMIVIVSGIYIILFLVINIIKLVLQRKSSMKEPIKRKKKMIVLTIIFSLIMPLAGLITNIAVDNLFGDFTHPAFIIILIINAVLLIAPPPKAPRLRMLRFFVLSVCTLYLAYFFIIFLPFIPLGIIGLSIILGVLVFAPIGALTMQIIHLKHEWEYITEQWNVGRFILIFIAGLLVLPLCILSSFIGDRNNLDNAASYLGYSANHEQPEINLARLQRTLKYASHDLNDDRELISLAVRNNIPIISSIYADVVLDRRVISEEYVNDLHKLFLDTSADDLLESNITTAGETINNIEKSVKLIDTSAKTVYDENIKAHRTTIDLTLQGKNGLSNQEYVIVFTLPEGVYISDYYLDVEGVRKKGLLVDQRAAWMVYKDIVTVKRDPGMLRYVGDRQIELRVFPFTDDTRRYTGFEIIHNDSLTLNIDNHKIKAEAAHTPQVINTGSVVLLPASIKQSLPKVQSKGLEYYFVIDSSANSDISYHMQKVKRYAKQESIDAAHVLFASYDVKEYRLNDIDFGEIHPQCGFNLRYAVRRILTEHDSDNIPIIVFVSGNPYGALMPNNNTLIAKQHPHSSYYYQLNPDMSLKPYRFDTNEVLDDVDNPILQTVVNYNGTLIKDNGESEIILSGDIPTDCMLTGDQYRDALIMDVLNQTGYASSKKGSLNLLRASFQTRVLTPQSAYIVVETKLQEEQLLKNQEEILNEDNLQTQRVALSEPSILITVLIGVVLIGGYYILKRRSYQTNKD